MRNKAAIFIVLSLFLAFAAGPATATDWGPLSRTWDGHERVSGNGTFYNSRNTHAKTKWQLSDEARDGNTIYGSTSVYIFRDCVTQGQRFCPSESYSSGEISNSTETRYGKSKLHSKGSRARGSVRVCVQLGFPRRDRCSDTAYPTFDY